MYTEWLATLVSPQTHYLPFFTNDRFSLIYRFPRAVKNPYGLWNTVWFYTVPVEADASFTPLFDQWTMPNFRVHSGVCGSHTYDDLIAAANETRITRHSLQADGINGSPETLWSMVK